MAKLGAHTRVNHVMVPIDFSNASLLVMNFIHQTLMKKEVRDKKSFSFDFIHIVPDKDLQDRDIPGPNHEKKWQKFKKIVRFSDNIPLEIVSSKSDIASTLSQIIIKRNCGMVIMGKRGLSGIKKWLLGSVSTGVLKQLTNQTLILID